MLHDDHMQLSPEMQRWSVRATEWMKQQEKLGRYDINSEHTLYLLVETIIHTYPGFHWLVRDVCEEQPQYVVDIFIPEIRKRLAAGVTHDEIWDAVRNYAIECISKKYVFGDCSMIKLPHNFIKALKPIKK